jgi:predicted NBD/HSP70 family sugar kinase
VAGPARLESCAELAEMGRTGKGPAIIAYITISTGVNGVRIVDGEIDRATYGFESSRSASL